MAILLPRPVSTPRCRLTVNSPQTGKTSVFLMLYDGAQAMWDMKKLGKEGKFEFEICVYAD